MQLPHCQLHVEPMERLVSYLWASEATKDSNHSTSKNRSFSSLRESSYYFPGLFNSFYYTQTHALTVSIELTLYSKVAAIFEQQLYLEHVELKYLASPHQKTLTIKRKNTLILRSILLAGSTKKCNLELVRENPINILNRCLQILLWVTYSNHGNTCKA